MDSSQIYPGSAHTPLATADLPGIGGLLTKEPEDFVVVETLPYDPCGSGEHYFVQVQKRGLSTSDVACLLADSVGVSSRDVGYAGRKDVHAVTTQWFSLPKEPQPISDSRVEILDVRSHTHKLRTGHVRSNHFQIRLRNVHEAAVERASAIVSSVEQGFPNYYGAQRFGREGRNIIQGLRWLERGCPRIRNPRFIVSALQSAVFNAWLGQRLLTEGLATAILGDVMKKRDTGGLFVCDDVLTDQNRLESGAIDICGPIFGPKMKLAEHLAGQREKDLVGRLNIPESASRALAKLGPGGRRVSRVQATDIQFSAKGTDLNLSFTLPSGTYATVFLAELMKPDSGWVRRE